MECTSTVLEISSSRIMKIYFHSLEYTKTDRLKLNYLEVWRQSAQSMLSLEL